MNDNLKNSFKEVIQNILKFVNGEIKEYIHNDIVYTSLDSFPDLPFLFIVCSSLQSDENEQIFHYELVKFIHNSNNSWKYFTGSHLYPVPVNKFVNFRFYKSCLPILNRRQNGNIWKDTLKDMNILYLNHLLKCLN